MQVEFVISKRRDAKMLYNFFHEIDPLGVEERAKENNIPLVVIENIQQMEKFKLEKETSLFNFAETLYLQFGAQLKKSKIAYEKEWAKVETKFSDTVETVTETRFRYDKYYVLLSTFLIGVSNGGDHNLVLVTGLADNPQEIPFLVAYEILMSHLISICGGLLPDETEAPTMKLWALTEATCTFILGIDMSGSWVGGGNDIDSCIKNMNYKKLKKLVKELRPVYEQRKSFQQYLNDAKNILEKNYQSYSFVD